jgi:glycosyltransferase involved in cell wall biosynthesis
MAPLLLHVFSTFAVGGPQVRFATIVNHFGPRWRHAVVAMDGNLACRERLDPELNVAFPAIPTRKGDTLGNIRVIRAALKEMRPAALLTSNWGTIEWAMANRSGLVRHIHVEDGFGPEERAAQLPRRVWTRRLCLAGRTVVVPSLTLRRIATETWRLNPARLRYIPNGVDLARFAPGGAATWPGEGPIIGTVAALRPEKNLARLIRAFARSSGARTNNGRLVIVGDGPHRAALGGLAAELDVSERVHFAGHIQDPAPLLRGMDIFAMTSDTEQMPISLLEAMAAGLPVACTDVGDIAAILPPQQQDYVVPLDDDAMAAALNRLLDDAPLRRTLGDANRARVAADFSEAAMLDAWAAIFDG